MASYRHLSFSYQNNQYPQEIQNPLLVSLPPRKFWNWVIKELQLIENSSTHYDNGIIYVAKSVTIFDNGESVLITGKTKQQKERVGARRRYRKKFTEVEFERWRRQKKKFHEGVDSKLIAKTLLKKSKGKTFQILDHIGSVNMPFQAIHSRKLSTKQNNAVTRLIIYWSWFFPADASWEYTNELRAQISTFLWKGRYSYKNLLIKRCPLGRHAQFCRRGGERSLVRWQLPLKFLGC